VTAVTDGTCRKRLSCASNEARKREAQRVSGQRPPAIVPATDRRSLWLAVFKEGDMTMTRISQVLVATTIFVAATSMASSANASEIVVSNPAQTSAPSNQQPAVQTNDNGNGRTVQSNNQPSGGKSTSSSIPNSSENYLDDRLAWPSAIEAKATLDGDYSDGYCIPAKTRLIGAHAALDTDVQQTTTTGSKTAGQTAGTSTSQFQAVTLDTDKPILGFLGKTPKKAVAPPADFATACPDVKTPQKNFSKGDLAYISAGDMDNVGYRAGFDYGALVVPFKMQLSGDKAFTGSSSLGGYVGWQNPIGDLGLNVSPIIFAGASSISTSATSGATTTSQTVAGLSYGAGLLFEIKDDFQAGVVLGFDHVSSAQNYQYNNKPWISFEIGYSFAN
jgi:hypothetical protein